MKSKNTTQNNVLIIFLIFIFLVFLQKNKFFRNLHNIHGNNLEKRLIQVYGVCDKQSYGFLNEIKNNYPLKENPKIIDYSTNPSPQWSIYDTSKKNSKNPRIFLNYSKNIKLKFFPRDNHFFNETHVRFTNQIETINFNISEPIKINSIIQIYKVTNNKKNIILEKKVNNFIKKNNIIILNYPTTAINSKWDNVYIDIVDLDKHSLKKINFIELKLKNKFQFSDDEIIFQKHNCYFIK